jgi:hypothetical protein
VTGLTQTLQYVVECLDQAEKLLAEVDTMGLWSRADDCSDNWRRRKGLRETDWTLWGAADKIDRILPDVPPVAAVLTEVRDEIRKLVTRVEPLPDLVTDIMLHLPSEVTTEISALRADIGTLRERAELLRQKSMPLTS